MKKSLKNWQKAGFLFTGIMGSLLHFLYEWTNESIFTALFSAVNESTWEHMKLLFVPLFIFALIQWKIRGRHYENFWWIKLFGTLAGLIAIPVLYYTYTGVFGKSADWFNIAIFFIAAAVTFCLEYRFFKRGVSFDLPQILAFSALCIILVAFVVLTFIQPGIPLFLDPVTNSYGR